jgi:hypothetical protein
LDTARWNATPVFQENFPNLANKGEFLGKYSKWSAYPTNYLVTDRQGYYDPGQISVKDVTVDGVTKRVMDCELRPKSMNGYQNMPSGCAPEPRGIVTKGEIVEVCFRTTDNDPAYHMANLGWPLRNEDWPEFGEPDFIEMDLGGTIGAWFHLWMATTGSDQIGFKTGTSTANFHVVRHERIPPRPGVSEPWRYKWFVDGVQQTPTNIDYWKNNGYIHTDGKTIKKRVPEREYRWVLQNETKGQSQQRASHVQYDWVPHLDPKV